MVRLIDQIRFRFIILVKKTMYFIYIIQLFFVIQVQRIFCININVTFTKTEIEYQRIYKEVGP